MDKPLSSCLSSIATLLLGTLVIALVISLYATGLHIVWVAINEYYFTGKVPSVNSCAGIMIFFAMVLLLIRFCIRGRLPEFDDKTSSAGRK